MIAFISQNGLQENPIWMVKLDFCVEKNPEANSLKSLDQLKTLVLQRFSTKNPADNSQ
jgi:hypothetical protein